MQRRFGPDAAFVAGGVALILVYFALPTGPAAEGIYEVLAVGAVLAIVAGIWLRRPDSVLPWVLFALGSAASALGNGLYPYRTDATAGAVADALYVAAYPLYAAALLVLLFRAGGHHRFGALAEAGVATFAFALVQWVALIQPVLSGGGSLHSRIVWVALPVGDVVLLAGFAGLLVSPAWQKPSFWLLLGAIASLLAADEAYGLRGTSFAVGSPIDAGWLLSYVLAGGAALHPSMRDLSLPRRSPKLRVSSWRIALLAAAILAPSAILLVQWARDAGNEAPAVFSATVPISILVVWRLTGIVRALERLRVREREARTDAVRSREQLAAQNARLREADRVKDEFVALISHDLRTPLTSIIGYTELALEEDESPLDPERRGYLEVVSRSSERLLHLVDDLLFVARLESGSGLEIKPMELDLADIAAQAADETRPRAEARGLELRFAGDGPLPVVADRGRLFQLLDNLLANALKFTPAPGVVELRVEPTPEGAALEVSDTGIGLPAGDPERLFERFFRSPQAVNSHIPGTGLGLFIARAIVHAHAGRISAVPRESGGTTFRIELPAQLPSVLPDSELVA